MTRIDVEPAAQVTTGTRLSPCLVISSKTSRTHDFATICAVDGWGAVLGDQIERSCIKTRSFQELDGRDYAAFPDIAMTRAGVVQLKVSVFKVDYAKSPPESELVESFFSREICVTDELVSVKKLDSGSKEGKVLRAMRRKGTFGFT